MFLQSSRAASDAAIKVHNDSMLNMEPLDLETISTELTAEHASGRASTATYTSIEAHVVSSSTIQPDLSHVEGQAAKASADTDDQLGLLVHIYVLTDL